ncbi:hypothetical protein IV203_009811 [Nitzschia inconspicua]|uniref:Uncharacterized protein n=1 Tax=Nitzschia inconspicua TaxID=303405 RepID=A0A9K3KVU4_9STRA|nr:hypothetical protein IV203_009811 [Nitzschia inconspicua]
MNENESTTEPLPNDATFSSLLLPIGGRNEGLLSVTCGQISKDQSSMSKKVGGSHVSDCDHGSGGASFEISTENHGQSAVAPVIDSREAPATTHTQGQKSSKGLPSQSSGTMCLVDPEVALFGDVGPDESHQLTGSKIGGSENRMYASLVMGEKLPPIASDIQYVLQDYNDATVFWNSVPTVLQDLDCELWRDRAFLKQSFRGVRQGMLHGPAFPVCLLLNCNSVEDRLKVMNWWYFLGRRRAEEWRKIVKVFARPTLTGERLVLTSLQAPTTKLDTIKKNQLRMHSMPTPSPKSKDNNESAKDPRMPQVPYLDLDVEKEDILQMMQRIYERMYETSGEDVDAALLRQNRAFRNGFILLCNSYNHLEPVYLLHNQKVMLTCHHCRDFTICNRLGLRHDTSPLCKACRKHEKNGNAKRRRAEVTGERWKENCTQLKELVRRQDKRIKSLQDTLDIYARDTSRSRG